MIHFSGKSNQRQGFRWKKYLHLANAIQYADFSDERQVRKIIRNVGKLANKKVSSHMEDELVKSIVNDGKAVNFSRYRENARIDKF